MSKGYNGKILRVDLSSREIRVEDVEEGVYRRYLGGGSLSLYYMLREMKPGTDPFGPDNLLCLMTSPTNGLPLSGLNRYTAAAKSPLTMGFGESEAGGWWGPELKAAGFDGVIVRGVSPQPVYLWINDGKAELRDATQYWGKLADEVQDGLEAEVGDKRVRTLQTGIAGEKLVSYAAMVNQLKHYHGRCGLGAVMGAKKLKAVVVRGRSKPDIADPEGAKAVLRWFQDHYDRATDPRHLWGTAGIVSSLDRDGILPTRNFREGSFELAREISGQTMGNTILTGRGTCYACAVACKRQVEVPELGVTDKIGGPEYETLAATGSMTGVGDLKQLALANQLLGQYVLDSISTGVVIAFAMECYEKGLLTKEDTGGLELRFGDEKVVIELIHRIGRREGIGDLLAEGVMRAAAKIGKGADRFAMHTKGQELPMHEPRGKRGLALAYATSSIGADHMKAPHDPFFESLDAEGHSSLASLGLLEPVDRLDLGPAKVRAYHYSQKVWSLYDSVGMCKFVGVPIGALAVNKLVEYVQAVTGWNASLWELLKVAERSEAMARLFNCREGFTPADDILPERMFEGLENGALQGKAIDHEELRQALRMYYEMQGWDQQTGRPTPTKLAELGLSWTET
ncbi:MAG: aldehyde ferredoxin oxidoreductase family protein [Candidatus Latescibacteria bacterium]|nr:aldehyde ferredoxin oxidoreductase family protein [Candidatus Latescibacterota bacterium]